jgi:hypothetical protein
VLSEHSLEKHGVSADESCLSSTELADSVSKREEGRAETAYIAGKCVGKKSKKTTGLRGAGKPLCMKRWLIQVQEMEKALLQDTW